MVVVIARSASDEAIRVSASGTMDCFRLRPPGYGAQVAYTRNWSDPLPLSASRQAYTRYFAFSCAAMPTAL
jgi:hypothetical protein